VAKRSTKAAPARRAAAEEKPIRAWVAPAVFILAAIIMFREFVFGMSGLLGQDTVALSYFARHFYTTFVETFRRFPLWDPMVFGGLPFVEGMHGDIFYPPTLSLFFMDTMRMWGWKMVLHVILAGVFTYLWLRQLGLRREIALFGGLVYMLGADLVSLVYPGGDGKLMVSALAPLAFWLTERAVRNHRIADYAWLSLGIALLVFTSHMQAAYFCIWGFSLYFIFRVVQTWRADRNGGRAAVAVGALAVAGVLGVGAASVQFFPPLQYLREWSHRAERTVEADRETAYQFATSYSINPEEAVSLIVPEFAGDQAMTQTRPNTYWGRNPLKLNNEYAGLVPLVLAGLLLLRRRTGQTWFFVGLGVLAVLYALGANTPFFRLFYLIPGVSLFRAPSIIIFLYGFAVATLGALGLQRALEWAANGADEQRSARRYLWITTAVFGVFALLATAGVVTNVWTSAIYRPESPDKLAAFQNALPMIRNGFWIAFLLVAAVAAVWEGHARGIYGARTAVVLTALLAFVDLYRVDRPFVESTVLLNQQVAPMFQSDDVIQFLQQRKQAGEVFRVFDATMPGSNRMAIFGLEQIAGHHGNEIGRYRTLVGGDNVATLAPPDFRVLDVTNTTYVVLPGLVQDPAFTEVYRGTTAVVYRKEGALPRAFLVGNAVVMPDSSAPVAMLGGTVDYRTTAILPEALPAGVTLSGAPVGGVEWVEPGVNEQTLRVQTDRDALLMVLDNYYPAWKATVSGKPVEILRANYTFRAIPIKAGQHDVVMRFDPGELRKWSFVSAALMLILLAAALLGSRRPSAPPVADAA